MAEPIPAVLPDCPYFGRQIAALAGYLLVQHVPVERAAELSRALRPIKTQLKISGCHASKSGTQNWLTVRSYIVTAIKHGHSAFDTISQAITGHAWMPPLQFT